MARYTHLWAFRPDERKTPLTQEGTDRENQYGMCAAPNLFPASQTGDKINSDTTKQPQIIDVVNDFNWTRSPREARIDVPQLILKEEKILMNPMLNKIANNYQVFQEKVYRFADRMKGDDGDGMISKILGATSNAANAAGSALRDSGELGEGIADVMRYLHTSDGTVMSAINKLYMTEETGFKYKFPYLSERGKTTQNQFAGSVDSTPMFQQAFDDITTGLASAATSLNITEPGTYIDQPKMYDYGSRDQKSYSVSIPLINTTNNFQDVIQNWQLLFMLIYQNTPNRITRDLIDPPRLYEAKIKGLWYSRWTYIQQLSVDFVGPTRRMMLPVPIVKEDDNGETSTELFNTETVIPDVYQLNLTVQEIIPETQNSLYAMLHETPSKVTVTKNFSQLDGGTNPAYDDPPSNIPDEGEEGAGLSKLKKLAGSALQVAGGVAAVAATVKGLKR